MTFETYVAIILFAAAPIMLVATWRKGFALPWGGRLTFRDAPIIVGMRTALMLAYLFLSAWLLRIGHVDAQLFLIATLALGMLWEAPALFRRRPPPPDDMVVSDKFGYSLLVFAGSVALSLAVVAFLWAASKFVTFH